MLDDGVQGWDDRVIGAGPMVILSEAPVAPTSSPARIVVGSEDGPIVALSVSRLPSFLVKHHDAFFLSADSTPIVTALRLFPLNAQPEAMILSAVLDAGCWFDLGLLDLLIRSATGDSVSKPRTEEELIAYLGEDASDTGENRSQISAIRSGNLLIRDRIGHLLAVACRLVTRAECFSGEVKRRREPDYRLGSPSPEDARVFCLRLQGLFRSAPERLVREGEPIAPQAADYLRRQLTDSDRPLLDLLAKANVQPAATTQRREPDAPDDGDCGVGTALKGTIALTAMKALRDRDGGRIGTDGLASLREIAEERYLNASRQLRSCSEAWKAFHWEGEVVARKRGHIETTKALGGWLRHAARRLVDRWDVPAPVPKTRELDPTQNPEHWGCWAACDRALWAWRELSRMAEVIRFATAAQSPAPQYEIVPRLRSFGPNLDVYRRLQVPVLRPRPGSVFLAGRVRDLRLRCFARLGPRRGYFHHGRGRLAGYFLTKPTPPSEDSLPKEPIPEVEPLAKIAAELYVASAIREAPTSLQPPHARGPNGTKDKKTKTDGAPIRHAFEERYEELDRTQLLVAESWRRCAEGLLNAAILGIPDAALGVFLECEYQVSDFGSLGVAGMLNLLASDVVYELEACLENRLTDIVWARTGRSAQDELHSRQSSSHPDTFAARVRNTLSGSGVAGLNLGADTHPAPNGSANSPPASGGDPALYMIRGQTLGGRFTLLGSQPTVIQQEVLLSADEVMLEVAHSVIAAGHHLIALAGEEFLVEVCHRDAERTQEAIRYAAETGAARLLGAHLLGIQHRHKCDHAVHLEPRDLW